MPTPFERVDARSPWQPPFAVEWNAMLDVAERGRNRPQVQREAVSTRYRPSITVQVRNSTGAAIDRFSVVPLNNAEYQTTTDEEFFHQFMFAITSLASLSRATIGVVPFAIPAGEVGAAVVAGLAYVKLDVGHANHDRCDSSSSVSSSLLTDFAGSGRILWKESGTGAKYGIVELGQPDVGRVLGVTATTISPGGTGSVTVWRNGVATTATITAGLKWMHGGQQVSSGKQVVCDWFSDRREWLIVGADCE